MPRWKPALLATVGATAIVTATLSTLPLFADEARTVTADPVADTTVSQVPQDGDGRTRTTLATCPSLCDKNPKGERDAVLEFAVAGLPADATNVRATLKVYAWQAYGAKVTAKAANGGARSAGDWTGRPQLGAALDSNSGVLAGYNDWNVSGAVKGNGTVTFALLQETHNSRVYWASRENSKAAIRPQLTVSYQTGGSTPAPSTPASPPASPVPAGWNLKWADEFNGSTMDTSKWNARNSRVDFDKACITNRPQNLQFKDGMAILRAQRETYTCGPETRPYTVSYLDTIGKASWTYGRFEVRAKSPNGPANSKGLWPAFWLRPNDGGIGEIDVTELPGGPTYYRRSTAAIFRDYTPTKQDTGITFPDGTYPGDGFHTYATEWEPGEMRWYIDGKLVWTRSPATTPWYTEAFSRPFNIRLNFQVGGWLGDPDANTAFPAEFQVDYVRVYQR